MDLRFQKLECPKCGDELEQGTIQVHDDVQMVKRCAGDCDFWMIIVIPDKAYEYNITKKLKKESV